MLYYPIRRRNGCRSRAGHPIAVWAFLLVAITAAPLWAANGQWELRVVDKDTGKPVVCRMHLLGPKKRPFKPEKVPFWHDHFVVPGKLLLKLPTGQYTFVLERGLEYLDQTGHFTIENFADDSKQVELHRFTDMAADGWWSGDLDVRRPARDIEPLMMADDLHLAEVMAWRNDKLPPAGQLPKEPWLRFDGNRYYHLLAGAWRRPGTELLLLNLPAPLRLPAAGGDYPPMLKILSEVRGKGELWVDASKPFWWDLPMLVAAGQIDSIEIAHSQLCRDTTVSDEADGKPRDRKRYPSFNGDAEWSQEIYFRLLECGLRLPPSAGSGSGDAPNPIGYNRVYVHADGPLTPEKWWEGLRAGQVFLTNGPLMRPAVEGELPGHVFSATAGTKLELEIALTLSTREPINYLEIIKDGHVEHEIRFDEYAKSGKLPKLHFDRSGWFLLRVVASVPGVYRFAMTAPYYVEIGYQRRISRQAVQFFLDWVYERARQIKLADPEQQREVLQAHRQARDYWQQLLSKANAE